MQVLEAIEEMQAAALRQQGDQPPGSEGTAPQASPTPYTLHSAPHTLCHAPCTLHPASFTLPLPYLAPIDPTPTPTPTPPYPNLPNPTLPNPTLLYPTLPCPALMPNPAGVPRL